MPPDESAKARIREHEDGEYSVLRRTYSRCFRTLVSEKHATRNSDVASQLRIYTIH